MQINQTVAVFRKGRSRKENGTKLALTPTSIDLHEEIPNSIGINNSDIDNGWEDMATDDK